MANTCVLPNELLIPIVGHLRDGKINHFDSAATKDLQTMRLVSFQFWAIATPMLFENMVLDMKLGHMEDANNEYSDPEIIKVHFATANPELAKHVHRLQLRVSSPIFHMYGERNPQCLFHVCRALEDWGSSGRAMAKVEGFIIGIPEWICSDQIVRIGVGKPLWDRPWTIKDTLALLPNLVHLENTMSAYYRKYLATIGASCTGASRTGASLMLSRDLDQEFVSDRAFVFLKGVQEVVSHMTETITSLKLCEVVAIDTDTFLNFPKNLQHLDLNLQLLWTLDEDRVPVLEKTIMEAWRKILKALTQLKSLRLTFECGKDHYADGHIHEDSPLSSDPLYMDDLLINPRDSADQSYFARLTSLRLVNCYLRVRGLQAIATRHNGTLKELELSRVTFDPLYCVGSWSEIGAMCHEALPNLRYLRLAKLITWFPNVRFEGEPEREAVPNRWNSGLEGATSYKWIKNGRGSGADYEFIGSKCPWLG